MLGDLFSVDWVSKIKLSEGRENQIRKTFGYTDVEFHYPSDVGEFDSVIESF